MSLTSFNCSSEISDAIPGSWTTYRPNDFRLMSALRRPSDCLPPKHRDFHEAAIFHDIHERYHRIMGEVGMADDVACVIDQLAAL